MMRFKYISVKCVFNYCLRDESIYIWHWGTFLCITKILLRRQFIKNSIHITIMNAVYSRGCGAKKKKGVGVLCRAALIGEVKVPLKQQLCWSDGGGADNCRTGAARSPERLRQRQKRKFFQAASDCQVEGLTQALADGHAVVLRVEVVAVAGAAAVDEAHALPLAHVEVPAGHGRAAGTRFRLQGAHR